MRVVCQVTIPLIGQLRGIFSFVQPLTDLDFLPTEITHLRKLLKAEHFETFPESRPKSRPISYSSLIVNLTR